MLAPLKLYGGASMGGHAWSVTSEDANDANGVEFQKSEHDRRRRITRKATLPIDFFVYCQPCGPYKWSAEKWVTSPGTTPYPHELVCQRAALCCEHLLETTHPELGSVKVLRKNAQRRLGSRPAVEVRLDESLKRTKKHLRQAYRYIQTKCIYTYSSSSL